MDQVVQAIGTKGLPKTGKGVQSTGKEMEQGQVQHPRDLDKS